MKLASVEYIKNVVKHPNADALDIVTILGYEAIVKRDQYKVNDLVVFIQPDSVLPDVEWAKMYKAKSSRVRAIKLRGSWSFGIVESLSILPQHPIDPVVWSIGQDVTAHLNITKYEAPVPQDLSAKGNLPFGIFITDEERYQNLDNLPYGQIVDVTLKIDGCLSEDTMLETDDGLKTIKYICETKYGGRVLSFDFNNNTLSYNTITNHSIKENIDNWYEIELENGGKLKVTGNHKIWLPELKCFRSVENLMENDTFLFKN